MSEAYLRRASAIAVFRHHGLSRRVFQACLARQILEKRYIPPLAAGEDPGSRRAFYSAASVARAVGQIQSEQQQAALPAPDA